MSKEKEQEYAYNVNEMRMAFSNKNHQESSLHLTKDTKITDRAAIDYLQHYMFYSTRTIKESLDKHFKIFLIVSLLIVILVIVILVFATMSYNIINKPISSPFQSKK